MNQTKRLICQPRAKSWRGRKVKGKVQNLITKYINSNSSATAKPRAPGPPPTRKGGRSRVSGTPTVGRGVGGKNEDRKGSSRFLEMWLGTREGDKGVRKSPERARKVEFEGEEGSQEGREKSGGKMIVPEAEEGRSTQERKRLGE